jgi:O-antigen ligase
MVFLRFKISQRLNKINFAHKSLYLFAFILIAISLPLSKFLTSIGIFLLAAVWLSEGKFRKKYQMSIESYLLPVFLCIYLVHILWLFYSTDFKYGLHDLQMKLPLLVFPIIMTTIEPLGLKQRRLLMGFFMLALFVSAIIGICILSGFGRKAITDAREISVFISHIRLSLMVNMGIFCGAWMLMNSGERLFRKENFVIVFLIVILAAFIFLLKSLTGIIVFIFLVVFTLAWIARQHLNRKIRYFLLIPIILIPLIIIGYSAYCFSRFGRADKIVFTNLAAKTLAGNKYVNDTTRNSIENGHYVWLYLCEEELKNAWNHRSSYDYSGKDKKGQEIKYTLIRYLTSKGLRKDSIGVSKLTEPDIRLVEDGIANYIYGNKWKLYPYIYRVLWEIDTYRQGDNPAGHSVAQRWIYLNIAKEIIQNHFWFGVGTGDVQKEFNKIYTSEYNNIPDHWRRRAHNQFITFWISFGLAGLIIILFAFFIPIVARIRVAGYLGYIFIIIAILSMLNEDTLETHAGATFISFFYCLFFMLKYPENKNTEIV